MYDHALLWVEKKDQRPPKRNYFKFLNNFVVVDGFSEAVANNLRILMAGGAMLVLWKKLQRLQPAIRRLSKSIGSI